MSKNLFLVLIFLVVFSSCASSSKKELDGGLLWEISGNGLEKPSYLLGTWHGTYDILYNYVDSIPGFHQAWNVCTQFVGEVDNLDDMQSIISSFDPRLPKDTTYADLLDKPALHYLDSVLKEKLNAPVDQMHLKPGFLSLLMNQLDEITMLKKAGYSDEQIDNLRKQVMDDVLINKAKETGYTVLGLETVEEQFKMLFSGGNLKEEADQLILGLKNQQIQKSLMTELQNAYRSQDINRITDYEETISTILQNGFMSKEQCQELMYKLLSQRNQAWVKKIPEIIKDNPTFIGVGVRHLPGEEGVICLLREKGYRVEAVK